MTGGLALLDSVAQIKLPVSPNALQRKLLLAAAVTAAADWLFYGGGFGISLPIFLTLLAGASYLANRSRAARRRSLVAGSVLALGLLPLIEHVGLIGLIFGLSGAALFALVLAGRNSGSLERNALAAPQVLLAGFHQLTADLVRSRRWSRRSSHVGLRARQFTVWLVPLGLGSVFILLFVFANPLIESWFADFDVRALIPKADYLRFAFWLAVMSAAWPFIRVRMHRVAKADRWGLAKPRSATSEAADSGETFGPAAILRSLLLFNLIFAVQTGLDLTYLWGGVALPDGMSYATYAHRGAYPLIVTALLAAVFVLAAMQPGGETETSPLIRALVFLWVGQNVLLVISSILRLDLYVEVYSLTYLRLAAFIWMGLVALGLVLIVARIALRRSNAWLIATNAGALALTLYVSAFVNFTNIIATYNVAHSWELSGKGEVLDRFYLVHLGSQAIPAIDQYVAHRRSNGEDVLLDLAGCIPDLIKHHHDAASDWRAWTFRGWRLTHYLDGRVRGDQLELGACGYL